MSVLTGWISDEAFRAELAALGHRPTVGQLEDWRGKDLLPRPKQIPHLDGSTVLHRPGEARQSLAIVRALDGKNRLDHAGQLLWAAGFDVHERYWRKRLVDADRLSRWGAIVMRRTLRTLTSKTMGELAREKLHFTGTIHKAARRLADDEFERGASLLAEVVGGDFERFEHDTGREGITGRTVALRALGFDEGQNHRIMERRFTPERVIEARLAEISRPRASHNWTPISDEEISTARTDVLNGLKASVCTHEALSWIYGPQAFGLRFAANLAQTFALPIIFNLTMEFARLRRVSDGLLTSAEIARMAEEAEEAEAMWLMSAYFQNLKGITPEMAKLISADRLKRAFSDSVEHQKLLEDLAGYQFPLPEFRPWDQWNKLAKRTMSPGLLAMSIGAPSTLDLATVVQSASGTTNR